MPKKIQDLRKQLAKLIQIFFKKILGIFSCWSFGINGRNSRGKSWTNSKLATSNSSWKNVTPNLPEASNTKGVIKSSVHRHPEFLGAHPYPHCVLIFRVFLSTPAPTLPHKKISKNGQESQFHINSSHVL